MVITAGQVHLEQVCTEIPPHGFGFPKVHGRPIHRKQAAGGNQLLINLRVRRGVQLQLMTEDIAAAVEIEIAVVGQTHRCGLIRFRIVCDPQHIPVQQLVGYPNVQCSRIPFLTCG